MKPASTQPFKNRQPGPARRPRGLKAGLDAFTLIETMITGTIFLFVVAGMLELHIFGLKLNYMVDVKLQATEDSRRALAQLVRDIHSAGVVRVGNGGAASFVEAAFNTPQEGNAIQIYPVKTDTNSFVRYFYDATDNQLKRLESGASTPVVVSGSITNAVVFTSEDYSGNILSNNFNNRVIGVDLEFYKLDNPLMSFDSGHYYDHYRLQTRVTRRALE